MNTWNNFNRINKCDPIGHKRDILSTFEQIEIFAFSNRRFKKLSNDTKFVKIEMILLKVKLLQSVYFLLFSLYYTHYFVHYLRINLADKMYLFIFYTLFCLWSQNKLGRQDVPFVVNCNWSQLQCITVLLFGQAMGINTV